MESDTEYLVDEATAIIAEDRHHYVIPRSREAVRHSFKNLGDALRNFASFARDTADEDHKSTFVYTHRRLARVFDSAFTTTDVKLHTLPTHGRLMQDLQWHGDPIPPRTVTLKKTATELHLTYETGFDATAETLWISADEADGLSCDILRNCGKGIDDTHAPYHPSVFERWRYGPSDIQFSIRQTEDGLRLGISHTPPESPRWYLPYSLLTSTGGPFANVTFSMADQTHVVKYYSDAYHP